MISVKDISKRFGKLQVLNSICLEFTKGRAYALIGPNGSGKTTLIKCMLGLVIPDGGNILVDGQSVLAAWKYREKIGYMPQIGRFPENMTIGQLFDMVRNIRAIQTMPDEELVEAFRLASIFDKRMHTLSGGTRQKVSAALAFLFNPPVLILDEPTAGLDPVSVEILKEKIQKEKVNGKLMIITSHIMSDLDEMVTDLVYLFEGNVHYQSTLHALKEETGHERLGKAISAIIQQREHYS
jgi:Cu-processing system ATP-binding protein